MSHHSDRHNLYSRWKSLRGITHAILAMVLLSQTAITMAQNSSLGKLGSASGIDLQVLSTSIASDSSGDIYYVNSAQSTLYRVAKTGVQTQLQCCGVLGAALPNLAASQLTAKVTSTSPIQATTGLLSSISQAMLLPLVRVVLTFSSGRCGTGLERRPLHL